MDCAGKIALVTGAAAGIGRAASVALAEAGAQLIITDIDQDALAETAALIGDAGGSAKGKVRVLPQDVTDEARWAHVIADIAAREQALHILVNNAGIAIGVSVVEMSLADWRRQMAVNMDGVFLGCKHAIPLMATSGSDGRKTSIINISSIAGLVGAAGLAGYCASKGGVRLFTKAVAMECANGGLPIRVNSVHPGIIDTDIWAKEIAGLATLSADLPMQQRAGANRIDIESFSAASVPGGKPGHPREIAQGIVFLASDASSYMTGAELVIDHGQTAQ